MGEEEGEGKIKRKKTHKKSKKNTKKNTQKNTEKNTQKKNNLIIFTICIIKLKNLDTTYPTQETLFFYFLFLPNHNLRPRPRLLLLLLSLIRPRLLRETLAPLHVGEVREFILLLLLLLLHLLIIVDLDAEKLKGVLGLVDRLDDVDVLGRRLLKNRVEVPRYLAVACGMAAVATVLALGVEEVGTGSVARSITHVVLVEVRTAKIEAHLAERHLVAKKVDVSRRS